MNLCFTCCVHYVWRFSAWFFDAANKKFDLGALLQNVGLEPSIFIDDDLHNVMEQEENDGIDLNDPPGTDTEDTLQQNTGDPAHVNAQVAGNNANGNASALVDEPNEDIS